MLHARDTGSTAAPASFSIFSLFFVQCDVLFVQHTSSERFRSIFSSLVVEMAKTLVMPHGIITKLNAFLS